MKNHPALVLNADYQPISYFPLSLWSWQDAIKAVFLDRVNIIAEYDNQVNSASFSMKIPSVVSLKTYINLSRKPAFTRFNLFLRDQFQCQSCFEKFKTSDLENIEKELVDILSEKEDPGIILNAHKNTPIEKAVMIMDIAYQNNYKIVLATSQK